MDTLAYAPQFDPLSKPSNNSQDLSLSQERNLLMVDGLGCLLLWQDPRIVIAGQATARQLAACHGAVEADVALKAGESPSQLVIVRDGEHYQAESDLPFLVNGNQTTCKLLFSGDTIQICPRGRLRFSRPVEASSTAILQPTAAGFTRGDIRYLVLMDDSLLFGARGSHFPIDSVDAVILLSLIENQFSIRTIDNGSTSESTNQNAYLLHADRPQMIEGLNFVLDQANISTRNPHAKV